MRKPIRPTATRWETIILTCGKCARKLDGGYGHKGKETLRALLRDGLKEAGRRRDVRLIETKCMGVCPKDATTMVVAAHPEVAYVVPTGTPLSDALALALEG